MRSFFRYWSMLVKWGLTLFASVCCQSRGLGDQQVWGIKNRSDSLNVRRELTGGERANVECIAGYSNMHRHIDVTPLYKNDCKAVHFQKQLYMLGLRDRWETDRQSISHTHLPAGPVNSGAAAFPFILTVCKL